MDGWFLLCVIGGFGMFVLLAKAVLRYRDARELHRVWGPARERPEAPDSEVHPPAA